MLGAQLAQIINSDLMGQTDVTHISKLRDEHLRPENIPNLRMPKMNEEIVPTDCELTKELVLVYIQQDVTTALTLMGDLMDDESRTNHKYSRQEIFSKANDCPLFGCIRIRNLPLLESRMLRVFCSLAYTLFVPRST